ncbi:MAG TPA: glycosyltransferase family 4 protein [Beijerinckiaceae bacterium]
MNQAVPIAFYAPLKSPHHPASSGDRTMARLLFMALERAGFAPDLASELRTFDGTGDATAQERLRIESEGEADRLLDLYRACSAGLRPRLWFTYHVYYKAPDWIGPRVAERLGIPYVIAEGSRAAKRADGPWALAHRGAEAALDRASAIFVMTPVDRQALERARPSRQVLVDLPPFTDAAEWADAPSSAPRHVREPHSGLRLLTVAMMRGGDKLASYAILAEALAGLGPGEWRLDVVGDGSARAEVETLLAPFGSRVRFHGHIGDRARLCEMYRQADVFVWPAVNEAYGMVLLEAQAFGCPVVAGAYGGVASVVRNDETGVLTSPGDAMALARAVTALRDAPERRRALAAAARRFVADERGLEQASARLRTSLVPIIGARAIS